MHQSQLADLYITCVSGSSELIEKWTSYPTLEINKRQRSVPFPLIHTTFHWGVFGGKCLFLEIPHNKNSWLWEHLKKNEGDFLKLSPRASSESKHKLPIICTSFEALNFPTNHVPPTHSRPSPPSAPWETLAQQKTGHISAFHSAMYPTWTGPSPKRWRQQFWWKWIFRWAFFCGVFVGSGGNGGLQKLWVSQKNHRVFRWNPEK